MLRKYDLVIVGAGPVGCILAERAANVMGWTCLVIEKRQHVGGNCCDFIHSSGLLLHRYGPHLFRTSKKSLVNYLGAFTEWMPGDYRVQAFYRGELYPLPINLTTLEKFFNRPLTQKSAQDLIRTKRIPIANPQNSEEYVLSQVGRELYEAFYLGYTQKQWGLHPSELCASVCGRIPIRFSRDDTYVHEKYRVMPKQGYTRLFENMLEHPLISVEVDKDYFDVRETIQPKIALVYSGPVDAYFNYRFGMLGWRSIEFEWVEMKQEYAQPCVSVNYPSDYEYTRSVEIKHVTGQKHPQTVLSFEYPRDEGEPYYPVPTKANLDTYARYKELAQKETRQRNVFFCGRLATYTYLNMDQAIERALDLFGVLKGRYAHA